MSQTPIYDQLRGQRVSRAARPAEVHLPVCTYPVGGEQGAAVVRGPRTDLPPAAHAR
ncbi:MAG TPA: hypothetical protein VE645_17235 [Pseudonocardiaceae bacterium]|nr:hypothetical protein [Pseudonocardiaceae bacterium]